MFQHLVDPGAPILVLTASIEAARQGAEKLGIEFVVSKPLSIDDLLDLVARAIESRRQPQQSSFRWRWPAANVLKGVQPMVYRVRNERGEFLSLVFQTPAEAYAYVSGYLEPLRGNGTAEANRVTGWSLWRCEDDKCTEMQGQGSFAAEVDKWGRARLDRSATLERE